VRATPQRASRRRDFERLAAALVVLDAHPVELGPSAPTPTAEQLRIAPILPPLSTRHGELHILNEVPGATTYAVMRTRALATDLDGVVMHIVGVDDLIRMKRATGRPSDIEDIEALMAVARLETNPGDGE
jgi:hypothetical protein